MLCVRPIPTIRGWNTINGLSTFVSILAVETDDHGCGATREQHKSLDSYANTTSDTVTALFDSTCMCLNIAAR